jgi:disulfide bond formation protein DsbB
MKDFGITDLFSRTSLYIALAVAWTAMLGSLYFSEVLHYLPCILCWYQRILMYPLSAILAVGLLRRDLNVSYYVLPLTVIGQGVSTYHYLLEKTDIFDATATCLSGIPCTTIWINWYGFITIPFLAMTAFFIITIMSLLAITSGEPMYFERGRTPWFQVGLTITLVIVGFVLLYQLRGPRASALTLTEINVPAAAANVQADATYRQGARLYAEACAVCHGGDATGMPNLGTSLVDSDIIDGDTAAALAFIRAGLELTSAENQSGLVMPPSGGRPDLNDEQMISIIDYLRSL